MLQRELVRGVDDIPELDSVVATGACQDVVGSGVERYIAHLPVGALGRAVIGQTLNDQLDETRATHLLLLCPER